MERRPCDGRQATLAGLWQVGASGKDSWAAHAMADAADSSVGLPPPVSRTELYPMDRRGRVSRRAARRNRVGNSYTELSERMYALRCEPVALRMRAVRDWHSWSRRPMQ